MRLNNPQEPAVFRPGFRAYVGQASSLARALASSIPLETVFEPAVVFAWLRRHQDPHKRGRMCYVGQASSLARAFRVRFQAQAGAEPVCDLDLQNMR
jgi:hypothetical protein